MCACCIVVWIKLYSNTRFAVKYTCLVSQCVSWFYSGPYCVQKCILLKTFTVSSFVLQTVSSTMFRVPRLYLSRKFPTESCLFKSSPTEDLARSLRNIMIAQDAQFWYEMLGSCLFWSLYLFRCWHYYPCKCTAIRLLYILLREPKGNLPYTHTHFKNLQT